MSGRIVRPADPTVVDKRGHNFTSGDTIDELCSNCSESVVPLWTCFLLKCVCTHTGIFKDSDTINRKSMSLWFFGHMTLAYVSFL